MGYEFLIVHVLRANALVLGMDNLTRERVADVAKALTHIADLIEAGEENKDDLFTQDFRDSVRSVL
jgi:hypothetical protein